MSLTQLQTDVLNIFLDGYEAKITSKMWASLAKCSKDTAIRDINDLVGKGVLRKDIPGAKRPSFSIVYSPDDISRFFSDIRIDYLTATYKGAAHVKERILPLDAERVKNGDLPLANLIAKYCSYLSGSILFS